MSRPILSSILLSALTACGAAAGGATTPDTRAAPIDELFAARGSRALELLRPYTTDAELAAAIAQGDEVTRRTATYDLIARFEARVANDDLLGRPGLVVVAPGGVVIARNRDLNSMLGARLEDPTALAALSGSEGSAVVSMDEPGVHLADGWARIATLAAVPIRATDGSITGVMLAAWPLGGLDAWSTRTENDLVLAHGGGVTSSLDPATAIAVAAATADVSEARVTIGGIERRAAAGPLAAAPDVRWTLIPRGTP